MADSAAADRSDPDVVAGQAGHGFHRSVGLLSATAVNMTQMVGIGPFIWTIVLTIPLIMATGIIGLEQYLGYFFPGLSYWPMHLIGVGVTAAIVLLLYRGIESVKAITTALWAIMLLAAGLTIAASYSNFHPVFAVMAIYLAMNIGVMGALPWPKVALVWSTFWLAAGAIAYLGWARYHRSWPFGGKEIHEEFLRNQRGHPERAASLVTGGEASWA